DRVRRDVHAQYLSVEYSYIAGHDQTDLINVLENETENVPEAYQTLMELFQETLAVIVFGVMVLLASWQIGLLAAAGAALLVALSHRLTRPIQKLNAVAIGQHRRMVQQILAGLQGMRAIRAFGQEAAERRRFARASRRLKETHRRIDVLQTYMDPV